MKNLITLAQVAILSVLAVYGAQAGSDRTQACPSLSTPEHCSVLR